MTPWTWDPSQVLSLEDFLQNKNEIVKKILIVCISQVDTTFKRQSLIWVTLHLRVYLKRASETPFLYLSFSPSFSPLFHLPSSFLLPGHEVTVLFSFFFPTQTWHDVPSGGPVLKSQLIMDWHLHLYRQKFNFSLCELIDMSLSVWFHMCRVAFIYVCKDAWGQPLVSFLKGSLFCFWDKGLTEPGTKKNVARLAVQWVPRIHLCLSFQYWDYRDASWWTVF